MSKRNLSTFRNSAQQFGTLRNALLKQLYPNAGNYDSKGNHANPGPQAFTNSFSRFAAYQPTAFDNGASRSSSGSEASTMERQVERALNQVLGRTPGRGANGFVSALNSVFPTASDGRQVVFTPSRSIMSLSGSSSMNITPTGTSVGQISARQATLYRQASVAANDALRLLEGLQPFVPEADADQVESLRALVHSHITVLVHEFGRVDEPRKELVKTYLASLQRHLGSFGRQAFLDDPALATTVDEEAQTASFELLKSYRITLQETWNRFDQGNQSQNKFSLSKSVDRAINLLPIVAQANRDFEAALDSIGFTESERRSLATRFNTLTGPYRFDRFLPALTINDLTEWIDHFASYDGPAALADAGLYGLDFVTIQADKLFVVIGAIVAHIRMKEDVLIAGTEPPLEEILLNERVIRALDNLLSQLHTLANLSMPDGGKPLANLSIPDSEKLAAAL